jgi:hypothetical protein
MKIVIKHMFMFKPGMAIHQKIGGFGIWTPYGADSGSNFFPNPNISILE